MKLPPAVDRPALLPAAFDVVKPRRDSRFPLFIAALLAAIAMLFKSDLFGSLEIWVVCGVMIVIGGGAVLGHLSSVGRPSVEHIIPALLGALAVGGLSLVIGGWWPYALVALGFGAAYYVSAEFDDRALRHHSRPLHLVLQTAVLVAALGASFLVIFVLQFPLPLRLASVLLASFLATYRAYRVTGTPLTARKALGFSVFVAQVVLFFTLGMSLLVYFTAGVFAVLMLLLWYVNQGIIRHAVDDSFSWQVAVEYGFFILLFLYIFLISFQPIR
ncbi:MAG TPA: hypothetical protein VIA06_07105 [Candidatus Dormibacteraeota bacterium]|nr:hypothetical protein [Candidatus Dormibacteraeota bacterium]